MTKKKRAELEADNDDATKSGMKEIERENEKNKERHGGRKKDSARRLGETNK